MDRNSVIGMVLIGVILILYFQFTKPSNEDIKRIQKQQDSIVNTEQQVEKTQIQKIDTLVNKDTLVTKTDSVKNINLKEKYGIFAKVSEGENKKIIIENKQLVITFSTLGGKIEKVQLKGYKTYDGKPVTLMDGDSTIFGLNFFANNKNITTDKLFFTPSIYTDDTIRVKDNPQKLEMSINLDNGKKIAYEYTVFPDSFLVDFNIKINKLNKIIANNTSTIMFDWRYKAKKLEKSKYNENRYSAIYYKHYQDDVDNLSLRSDDKEEIPTKIKWVAFKQQFFSAIMIAKISFENTLLEQKVIKDNDNYLKDFHANIMLTYPITAPSNYTFQANMLFVPNQYHLLRKYSKNYEANNDLKFDKLLNLGWTIFGWVNKFLIIPIFNLLSRFIHNYGLIILLLTLIIKGMLFPFTYKSYLSTAKMRVLKPQIDEINKRIPPEKNLERQQATMALYKKAGVNPMGGCLPMLLQLPILYAMFMFFPTSIELRQQSFLWVKDLSSYDSIWNLPFKIPFYGDHVSLFALLMTISMLIYTKMQQEMNPSNQSMPGMKVMMYLVPIFFLGFFNNYSAALSYYYFLANLITIGQMYYFRKKVDDKKLLAQLEKNKQKPVKKSKFQQRLEEMAKQKGYNPPKKR